MTWNHLKGSHVKTNEYGVKLMKIMNQLKETWEKKEYFERIT